jgi:hypothetical protein
MNQMEKSMVHVRYHLSYSNHIFEGMSPDSIDAKIPVDVGNRPPWPKRVLFCLRSFASPANITCAKDLSCFAGIYWFICLSLVNFVHVSEFQQFQENKAE